jgi:NhaP-type Na+/H+ or K+/H+ antiporter
MFVFVYMGVSVWTLSFEATLPTSVNNGFAQWSPQLIAASCLATWLMRGFVVATHTWLANRVRKQPIQHKESIVIFFSGTMRGCVAFALALKVDEDEHGLEEGVFSTTILAISIFTTLVFGGLSAPILMALGLKSLPGTHVPPVTNGSSEHFSELNVCRYKPHLTFHIFGRSR